MISARAPRLNRLDAHALRRRDDLIDRGRQDLIHHPLQDSRAQLDVGDDADAASGGRHRVNQPGQTEQLEGRLGRCDIDPLGTCRTAWDVNCSRKGPRPTIWSTHQISDSRFRMRAENQPLRNSGYRSISAARSNACSQVKGRTPLDLLITELISSAYRQRWQMIGRNH